MTYSYRKGFYKMLSTGLIISLATVITAIIDQVVGQDLWGVNTITIGAALMFLKNMIKVKMQLGFK